jgi:hypothetical protein
MLMCVICHGNPPLSSIQSDLWSSPVALSLNLAEAPEG